MRLLTLVLGLSLLTSAFAQRPPLPCAEPTHDNAVVPVFGARPYIERLLMDLAAARRSILVDYYILGGHHGERVAHALAQRHKAGLDVRVMLDGHRGTLPKIRAEVKRVLAVLGPAGVPLRWGVPRRTHGVVRSWTEDHNKVVILDGRVAWCGGANISDSFDRFNDLMLRVEGPAAATIGAQFEHDWALAGEGADPQGPDAVHQAQGLLPAGSKPGLSTIRVVGTGPGRVTFEGALVNAIRSARRQIQVQQQQFGYDVIIDELIAAHRRGVEVRVLVDPCNIDNFIPVFHHGPRAIFNAHAVLKLKEAGITVRAVKVEDVFDAYHMKLGTFDRSVMLVGSGNWEQVGCRRSTETVLEVSGGPAVSRVVEWHDRLWEAQSEEPRVGYFAHLVNHLIGLYM